MIWRCRYLDHGNNNLFLCTSKRYCCMSTFVEFFPDLLPCITWYSLEFTLYYVAKFFIWYYSVTRLKIVFDDTLFLKYPSNFLIFITFMFLMTATGLSTFMISTVYVLQLIPNNDKICTFAAPIWYLSVVGIFDSIMGILCYWLFYRKMNILIILRNQHPNAISSSISQAMTRARARTLSDAEQRCGYELAYILRKYAILSASTLLSTWIAAGSASFLKLQWEDLQLIQ